VQQVLGDDRLDLGQLEDLMPMRLRVAPYTSLYQAGTSLAASDMN
jgi:hypothetical protein